MVQQTFRSLPQIFKRIIGIVTLAIAYYVTAELCRQVASTPQDVTPVWPPDGIGVGAVFWFGNWMGYGVLLGSFLANFWAFRDTSSVLSLMISILPVLGIAIGTTFGTLLGVFLLRKLTTRDNPLERVTDVFKFLVFTGMVGPIVNATVGVASLALSRNITWTNYSTVWLIWWVSNISGIFIVTPILLSWGQLTKTSQYFRWHPRPDSAPPQPLEPPAPLDEGRSHLTNRVCVETVFLLGLLILIARIAFGQGYRLEYMLIPILLWSAFRVGQQGATLLTFVVGAIAVMATVNGQGSFAATDINESLIQLQLFIGAITLTILLLTATIAERAQSDRKLRLAFAELARTNETLESRVRQRTEELNRKNIDLQKTLDTLEQTQLQIVQSEKMSALGQMVAGIAHEINNPVNFIHGNIEYLDSYFHDLLNVIAEYQTHYPHPFQAIQSRLDDVDLPFLQADMQKLFTSMSIGTGRIRKIVLSLRNFSRLDEAALKVVDIHEGLDNALLILQHRFEETADSHTIQIVKQYNQLPLVECYPAQLNQVFMAVLANAIDALQGNAFEDDEIYGTAQSQRGSDRLPLSPMITISTQLRETQWIQIAIADNGIGVPDTAQSRVFDPFFTTKLVNQGTGLGLSISYQIITQQHHGNIWFQSTRGEGTVFFIEIPISTGL